MVGIHHVPRLGLDYSYHCGQIGRTLDEGVQVDCPEQEVPGLQKLVACDANKHISMRSSEKRGMKLTSPSPPRLPNVTPLPCCAKPDGGLPPLAAGCGIGEGDCAGEETLGFPGIGMGAEPVDWAICGVLWEAAGESVIEPN